MLFKTLPLMALAVTALALPAEKPFTIQTAIPSMTTTQAHIKPSLPISKGTFPWATPSFSTVVGSFSIPSHSAPFPMGIQGRAMRSDHPPHPSFTPGPGSHHPAPTGYPTGFPSSFPASWKPMSSGLPHMDK
ncbi:hypothetical protein F5Y04DRAFT_279525 [Hypomontagnella monticulosa]|nr:hypothetical protein F5Y04DRAFT_279525 [Hypomontagnella monticulosa]